jgi:hypothetical protein
MTERAPGSGVALGSVIPDNENAPVGLPGWTDVSQRISREWDRAVSFFGRLLRRRLVAIAAEYRLLGVRAFRLVENATDTGPFNCTRDAVATGEKQCCLHGNKGIAPLVNLDQFSRVMATALRRGTSCSEKLA